MRGPGDDQQAEPLAAMRARVAASFARQAMMATLGAELVSVERGRVELALPHDERFTQQHGFVHAGAVAAVLDSACGYAAFSVMPPFQPSVKFSMAATRSLDERAYDGDRTRPAWYGVGC